MLRSSKYLDLPDDWGIDVWLDGKERGVIRLCRLTNISMTLSWEKELELLTVDNNVQVLNISL